MQKPWPKQRSVLLRASTRGTPKRSLLMVTCDSRPLTEIEPLVFGSGWRKRRCHRPNDAAPADARAAAPVRLLARPATRRFSQTLEVPWLGGGSGLVMRSSREAFRDGKEVEARRAVRDAASARPAQERGAAAGGRHRPGQ